jgi:WD40 repeat protein
MRSLRPPEFPLGFLQRLFCGHTERVTSVAFDGEGRRIASSSRDNTIRVWDTETQAQLLCLSPCNAELRGIAFSQDGRYLAAAMGDQTVPLWDVASGAELRRIVGPGLSVLSVAFAPDGRRLAAGSADGSLTVWADRYRFARQNRSHLAVNQW